MKKSLHLLLCVVVTLLVQSCALASESRAPVQTVEGRAVVGWVEFVTLEDFDVIAKAKLDSGAMTSSLHAEKIEYFERDGRQWVRFEFDKKARPPLHGMPAVPRQTRTIEAPLKRMVKIKQHTVKYVQRPAVELALRIGDQVYHVEFTLTNRDSFIYPVLLGRRFLQTALIIDPARIHVTGAPESLLVIASDE